jgi:UDP-N-acetylglucosamine 2-epimerase
MGTRPEIIKMAPVYHELKRRGMGPLLLHTGQHQEMANPLYEFFHMLPDYSLDLQRTSDSLHHLSALLLEELGEAFEAIRPSATLVHGDTTSAAMAALAAYYHKIPVGHVEAGLRSHCEYDPFPEEKNRELIGRLAHWHFAPTARAAANLERENVADDRVHVVGNTVVDAIRLVTTVFRDRLDHAAGIERGDLRVLPALIRTHRLVLVTAHRRENLGGPLLSIARAVRRLVEDDPDLVVVWPVHSNPRVGATVHETFADVPAGAAGRVFLTRPLDYPTTLWLLRHAWLVLTDSGGIQEESACTRTPVLVLRETTERPELIESGGGLLVGTDTDRIVATVRRLAANASTYAAMRDIVNPFGDGFAVKRICDVIAGPPVGRRYADCAAQVLR